MTSKQPQSAKQRREQAAAARAAQQAAEARRDRTIKIVGGLAVLVVVGAIIAVGVIGSRSGDNGGSAGPTNDPAAKLPQTVQTSTYGVPYGTGTDAVPLLEVWEDFQCPACAAVEKANGAGMEKLATDGKIRLLWRPTYFLDTNLKNDSSKRAIMAWGCAIDQGKAKEYHNAVFANQPATEGEGYTDEKLIAIAEQVGITGAKKDQFTTCLNDRVYAGWAQNSEAAFQAAGVPGTPTGYLNGKEIQAATLADPAKLEAAIAEAAKS